MEMAWKRFQSAETGGKIDLVGFSKLLGVEPTGEVKRLFYLFDNDESGTVDIKEFLLGLSNFASDDKTKKVKFCFLLYDEDRNGFITEEELIQVLKANHMATNEAQVIRKAKTIMRQADQNGDGKISPEEFMTIATKFPNILFPATTFTTLMRKIMK